VKRPPDDIKKVRTSIKDKEVKPLLDLYDEETRQGLQNKTILTLFAYTAQRVSTIRVLQVKSVSEIDGVLVLTLKIKGGKIRHLPLAHEPARLVRKILAFKTSPDDFLFTPQRGTHRGQNKPITSVAIWYLIKNSLKKARLDESRSAHSFRRAVLTKLMNTEGVSSEKIRDEVSFHSSLDTLSLYKIEGEQKMTENPILGIVYHK
jgi:integrase